MGRTAPSVSDTRVKKEKLYHTTVLFNSLEKTLVAIRKEAGVDQKLQQRSQKLVEEQAPNFRAKSNSTESREFGHYVHFCISLSFPPFPVTPVKAALAVARYVSLPISAKLRALSRAGEAQGNALRPHNAWAAIDTLGIAARASAPVWEGVATGFVEDPERYVLFHEIIEAAEKVNRSPISTETALAELLKARPQLGRVRSSTPPAPPMPLGESLAVGQDPRAAAPVAGYRALTQTEKKSMRKYRNQTMPLVLYQSLMQDFNTIVMDMALHRDRDQYVDQAHQGARLADFQLRPHPRSARIRDVHVLYTHLCHVLNLQPYPITPLRLALFALAYSPHLRHVDRFDRALAARPFVQARKYPRLLRQEMVHALDDLELIQVVSRGQEEGERVSPFEMEQWGEWRMGIMQDLWG